MVDISEALEGLYDGMCDIIEYKPIKEGDITEFDEVITAENVPCRLSYRTLYSGVQSRAADYTKQKVKLFLSEDIVIRAGSKVRVRQNGVCIDYKCSGEPALYLSHQEVLLELFEGWG